MSEQMMDEIVGNYKIEIGEFKNIIKDMKEDN